MIISLTVHAMCEQIKCAGRNNFNTNQFKTKLFQDIFWPSHSQFRCTFRSSLSTVKLQRWVYFWQRPPTSPSWSYPETISSQPGPTSLFEEEKACWGYSWWIGKLRDRPDAFRRQGLQDRGVGVDYVFCTGIDTGPAMTVWIFSKWKLPGTQLHKRPDFWNSGGVSNHDAQPFRHFSFCFL